MKRAPGQVSAGNDDELVSVRTVELKNAYRPALVAGASKELDRVAGEVAQGLHGELSTTCKRCRKVGTDALTRGYDIRYGDLVQEITFVLVDKREYQLTCRRKRDGDGSACDQLRSSFRLA